MTTSESSSSLSSAQSDLLDETTPVTSLTSEYFNPEAAAIEGTTGTSKKRKANNVTSASKRTKRASETSAVKVEASRSTGSRERSSTSITTASGRPRRAATKGKPAYEERSDNDDEGDEAENTTKKPTAAVIRAKKTRVKAVKFEVEEQEVADPEERPPQVKARSKAKTKKTVKVEAVETEEKEEVTEVKKPAKKRKTKEEKEAEMQPLAARTVGAKVVLGAHVSAAGGVHNAVANSVHIGGNAFALFLKSQRKWANPPLKPEHTTLFHGHCKEHSFQPHAHVVPHGSYLVNLAHTDPTRTKQAYDSFLDDLARCHALGIRLYNFHPGNSASSDRTRAIAHLAANLNRAHRDPASGAVVTLLETMATAGKTIGGTFEDLAAVIAQVEDRSRVGVCLDTCHIFAAGYDLRSPAAFRDTLARFDEVVGLQYLKAVHVNDSKAPLGSHRDLHANIGTGWLGLRAFWNLVNEPRLWGLPMVLETPIEARDEATGKSVEDKGIWAREIKLLEGLVGADVESEAFRTMEAELQERGRAERERVADQVERKREKDKKAKEKKAKGRGRKKVEASEEESGSGSDGEGSEVD